jgi:membrane dipeptidase
MTKYTLRNDTPSHTDITRLRTGQVGGQFWAIYTSCNHQGKDATISFMEQIDLMNRLIAKEPGVFQMARTADEVRQAFQAKRIASLFGVESGQAIESTFSILRLLYQLGVRYMTLTHNCNTPWYEYLSLINKSKIFIGLIKIKWIVLIQH